MCGIGGVLHPVGRPCDEAALHRMSEAMHERGPDDHGQLTDAGAGLVHRRLSILDLSSAGRCPIPNEDASVHAVLNGEIYNFVELREELIGKGHHFRSHCDSEVVVHGYEEWGEELVARLHGMFALAVWDSPRRRLLIAGGGAKEAGTRGSSGGICKASSNPPRFFNFCAHLEVVVEAGEGNLVLLQLRGEPQVRSRRSE